MGEIGRGYGSEYQLLRFLGHHRIELDTMIKEKLGLNDHLIWLDFPYDSDKISFDGEITGIQFLRNHPRFKEIETKWEKFWPQKGTIQNWDAIIVCNNKFILVEAKAYADELITKCGAKNSNSINLINSAFILTQQLLGITLNEDWIKSNYYQYANHLAVINFLRSVKIDAVLLNIYFTNGYIVRNKSDNNMVVKEDKSVKSIEDWENIINEKYDQLGLSRYDLNGFSYDLFVECKK